MVVNPLDLWLHHSAAKQKDKLNAHAKTGKVIGDHLAVGLCTHTPCESQVGECVLSGSGIQEHEN